MDHASMWSSVRRVAILAIVALTLHGIWEQAHIPLYTAYDELTELPILYYAVAGDVMYTMIAVGFVSLLKRRSLWFAAPSMRDLLGLALIGFGIALFVEYKAFALGSWAYTEAMPIIPILGVGLSPVLQMVLLLPLSVAVAAEIDKAIRRLLW